MRHEGLTLRTVAPERSVHGGRWSVIIAEAIEFGVRCIRPLRQRVNSHDVVGASVFPYFSVLGAALATGATETSIVTTWHEVWLDYWEDYLGRSLQEESLLNGSRLRRLRSRSPSLV